MKSITRLGILATAGAALAVSSCSTGGRSPSGFLTNYQQLDGGYGTADAVSAFVKPGANLAKYDSVIIDPVTTIVAAPVSPAVKEQIAAFVGDSLRRELGGNFRITTVPGPTTLQVRTALTDVIEGRTGGRPITTIHTAPQVTLTGTLGSVEVASFISNVSFEGELVDSVTRERLAANIDHRLGKKREASPTTSWAGVRSAVNQGVVRLRERFMTVRAR